MFDAVWSTVAGRRYSNCEAVLRGFRRHAVRDELYPAVVRSQISTSKVVGRLYLDVTGEDLDRLDAFEGAQYQRISCQASEPGKSASIEAQVYLFLRPELLLPEDWDEVGFRAIGMAQFLKTYAPKP